MNRYQTKKIPGVRLAGGLIALSLVLGACAKPSVQIALVEPMTEAGRYEKYDVKNCDSALADLYEPVTAHFKVQQEISIADQAASTASGAAHQLSAVEKESLAAQVEAAYQQKYSAAQAELEKQEFFAPKDRIANYSIRWNAQVYKSTLLYDFKGEALSVEYQYTLTIPVVGESTIAICGG